MKRINTFIPLLYFILLSGIITGQECQPPCDNGCCEPPCKPDPPCLDCGSDGSIVPVVTSKDPNDIIPPKGIGDKNWIRKDWELNYTVLFENLPTASAAAQRVEVKLPVLENVDLSSYRIGDMGFSFIYVEAPPDTHAYSVLLPLDSLIGVDVDVAAGISTVSEEAYWVFQSLDSTGQPPLDPLAGFLPPNDTVSGDGEGFVTFRFFADSLSQTFDEIDTYGAIIFDDNDTINTPMAMLTIDDDPPSSTIDTVFYNPDSARYQIVMSGSDIGSGLKSYTLFVSEDGSSYEPLLENWIDSNAYVHLRVGTEYRFITLARDSVDWIEPEKQQPDYVFTPTDLMLHIDLVQGWNLVSSYFRPSTPDMVDIVSPIDTQVVIVKDFQGQAAIPSLPLNSIGDWEVEKGYQIKATENTILPIAGDPVLPENTVVPIREGWQILPYLRRQPMLLEKALTPINYAVTIVKDNDGNIYFPQLGIDNIGLMEPTQGYWLKSTNGGYLYFTENVTDAPPLEWKERSVEHFDLDDLNTGNNASLIIPYDLLMNSLHLSEDDEIGVFTENGQLCGSGVFTGSNMALSIWGDDIQSPNAIEGMTDGEVFSLKIWEAGTDEEFDLNFTLESGAPLYFPQEIYMVETLEADVSSATVDLNRNLYFNYFPNPATGNVNFSIGLAKTTQVQLSIHSVDGRYSNIISFESYSAGLHQFSRDFSELASGMYIIRVVSDEGIMAYRLLLQR